jgi:hypothetical protein
MGAGTGKVDAHLIALTLWSEGREARRCAGAALFGFECV